MSDALDDQYGQTECAVESLTLTVFGTPAPQGSKDAMPIYRNDGEGGKEFTGQVVLLESARSGVDAWRAEVVKVARPALVEHRNRVPFLGALAVGFRFTVHRGKTVTRPFPSVRPDLDKLARSTGDGLTDSGLIGDDALIVGFTALEKAYAGGTWLDGTPALDRPGAVITIRALEPNPRLVTKRRVPRSSAVPLPGHQESAPVRSRLVGPPRPVEPSPALLEALRASGTGSEADLWT